MFCMPPLHMDHRVYARYLPEQVRSSHAVGMTTLQQGPTDPSHHSQETLPGKQQPGCTEAYACMSTHMAVNIPNCDSASSHPPAAPTKSLSRT